MSYCILYTYNISKLIENFQIIANLCLFRYFVKELFHMKKKFKATLKRVTKPKNILVFSMEITYQNCQKTLNNSK